MVDQAVGTAEWSAPGLRRRVPSKQRQVLSSVLFRRIANIRRHRRKARQRGDVDAMLSERRPELRGRGLVER